jgi:hypothetical protein
MHQHIEPMNAIIFGDYNPAFHLQCRCCKYNVDIFVMKCKISFMLICFDSTGEAKKALDALLETREFRDVSEVVCMALVNYEAMHRTIGKGGAVIGDAAPPPHVEAAPRAEPTRKAVSVPPTPDAGQLATWKEALETFSLKVSSVEGIDLLPVAELGKPVVTDLPPKEWLFGQLNRLLPAKATCRALLNLQRENPKGVLVSDASSKIAFAACRLGDFLRELDRRFNLAREVSLAAAFPSTEYHGAESRVRFGSQFVGTLRQGQLTGLPAGMKLLGHDAAKDPRLLLTQAGAQFALLANPILDAGETAGREKLSEAEIRFLLEHIKKQVPAEVSAYVAVIDGIRAKANTPDKLDEYLCQRFQLKLVDKADAKKPDEISKTFLSTQRTGAISRMADLNLVRREKQGLNVTYAVSHPGECFRSEIQ